MLLEVGKLVRWRHREYLVARITYTASRMTATESSEDLNRRMVDNARQLVLKKDLDIFLPGEIIQYNVNLVELTTGTETFIIYNSIEARKEGQLDVGSPCGELAEDSGEGVPDPRTGGEQAGIPDELGFIRSLET